MNLKERLMAYADVEEQVPLKKKTTFRIGGTCDYFVYPKSAMCLMRIMDILKEEDMEVKIFGKGSNVLCSDHDYHGVIICLDRHLSDYYFEEDGTCVVMAGTSIILLAHEAMKRSFTGLEFASGIPGTVGGALFMNAGAYKSDMAGIVKEVYVLREGTICTMPVEALDFAYRHSIFQTHRDWMILGCRMQLTKGNQEAIMDLMNTRRTRRIASQPLNKPSCGSVFRNPQDHQAWQLIESVGLRGKRIGGAMVSDKHANFIVNEGDAKASDVMELIELIKKEVKAKYDVDMITEVEKFNW